MGRIAGRFARWSLGGEHARSARGNGRPAGAGNQARRACQGRTRQTGHSSRDSGEWRPSASRTAMPGSPTGPARPHWHCPIPSCSRPVCSAESGACTPSPMNFGCSPPGRIVVDGTHEEPNRSPRRPAHRRSRLARFPHVLPGFVRCTPRRFAIFHDHLAVTWVARRTIILFYWRSIYQKDLTFGDDW